MSAHAFWATSGCQLLSLVGERVSHQMTTPPKRIATAPTLRQNGLTNTSTAADATARSPARTLFAFPNGASNHTAPNAQAITIMAVRRMSSSPTQRITRTRLSLAISAGFTIAFRPIVGRSPRRTPAWYTSIGVSQKCPTDRFLKPLLRQMKHLHQPRRRHGDECLEQKVAVGGFDGTWY